MGIVIFAIACHTGINWLMLEETCYTYVNVIPMILPMTLVNIFTWSAISESPGTSIF